jgi:hypothetical protein
MTYSLFDSESMNLIDWFDSLDEALDAVRETIQVHGTEAVATWVLAPDDTDQQPLRSEELVRRAMAGISV